MTLVDSAQVRHTPSSAEKRAALSSRSGTSRSDLRRILTPTASASPLGRQVRGLSRRASSVASPEDPMEVSVVKTGG